jgi:GNAT superfamily N-acetyltransferase
MEGSTTPDRDALLAFELALDERVIDEVRTESWGRAFLTPSLPLIWDANWVGIEATGLPIEEVVAIADETLGGAGFAHRTVCALDEADGRRLGEAVEAEPVRWPGWEVERIRYMVWDGSAAEVPAVSSRLPVDSPGKCERPGMVSSQTSSDSDEKCERAGVREVRLAEIEGLRRALIEEEAAPTGVEQPEATVDQLFELNRRLGAAGGDRWFAAPAAGEPLSCCQLLRQDGIGQVEDVGTLAHARERGYAKAIVLAAVAAARAAGDSTIFLTADATDWPQLMYARLGFETVGDLTVLRRRP